MSSFTDGRSIATDRAGFTLIEILGAFFMMVVILVFITGIFVENGRQRAAATELMRDRLSATAALALIASDLESAVLLTPTEGDDAENHAWKFIADGAGEFGARSIHFVTQNAPTVNSGENSSSWVEVAYFLETDRDDQRVLWRWRSSRPPAGSPRSLPDSSDPGSARVAIDVSEFGVRLLDFQGNWVDDWDSTYQPPDEMLPDAAEITIELYRSPRAGRAGDAEDPAKGLAQTRRVTLAIPPIDVTALIALESDGDGDGDGEGDEPACFTIGRCLAEGQSDWYTTELEDECGGDERLCDLLANPNVSCWSSIEISYPELAAQAPGSCES